MKDLERLELAKTVFQLRTVQGKKLREVAAELGLRHNTQVSRRNQYYRDVAKIMEVTLPPRRKLKKELNNG